MKLKIIVSNKFKKDLKKLVKQGKDLSLLEEVIEKLASGKNLDNRYRDHFLTGNYSDFKECHIKPDWLLIYKIEKEKLFLFLVRTGSHSELF